MPTAFTDVAAAVERLVSRKELEKPPSFFEFLTATAFLHFAQAGAKFVVLEVGMGGRLDATNVTDPRVALITNIDFDHMEFLGSTLAAIAAEKAGIIKPHRPSDFRSGRCGRPPQLFAAAPRNAERSCWN